MIVIGACYVRHGDWSQNDTAVFRVPVRVKVYARFDDCSKVRVINDIAVFESLFVRKGMLDLMNVDHPVDQLA